MADLEMTVNGEPHSLNIDTRLLLVDVLREELGLAGPRIGCLTGDCGACTVRVDGLVKKSCLILGLAADGAEIVTLEGIAEEDDLHPLQEAFCTEHAFQCGYCLSGMVFAAQSLLDEVSDPTDAEIRHAIEGNLCRCTGYTNIVAAVRRAVELADTELKSAEQEG